MADISAQSDGPKPSDPIAFDISKLPDFDNDFIDPDDIFAFQNALDAPEISPSQDDLSIMTQEQTPQFITALNDWRPVRQRVRKRKTPQRGLDETREGYLYGLLKWPLLFTVLGWILFLGISYLLTRFYIFLYETLVTWRGRRERLRKSLQSQLSYEEWVQAATKLDAFLKNDRWKTKEEYAYYDAKSIKRIRNRMLQCRKEAEVAEKSPDATTVPGGRPVDELRTLLEGCIRDNFVGFENPRLYSETYFGTKELVQSFIDEAENSLRFLRKTEQLDKQSKREIWKHIQGNFGRTALCLSGGATFAYYHFGVAKALLDADLLPQVITGTSGGALVAALLATRTEKELKQLLVPALAERITACHDSTWTWMKRWWKTGARFDSVDWARRCSWFTRGSMTFREAYKRTGRILNVSCVPSDPHSPTILANYLTSPDCVIWSAILASAAVPGILNPVVLMKKNHNGELEPFSFGQKWKDGSLRTDIPLKALNLHFNVNFTIVSQVNPHINLFFFSSRGTVGRPVTHRRGRGWRGGFLGSATEQYLKLDMNKWLKVLRHLELLPRPMNQDWSQLWLQRFSGTITIWPKSITSDFYYILTDPTPKRLARMIRVGQLATWPKLKFIANRMKLERAIDLGRRAARSSTSTKGLADILSEDDLRRLLKDKTNKNIVRRRVLSNAASSEDEMDAPRLRPFTDSQIEKRTSMSPPHTPQPGSGVTSPRFEGTPTFGTRVRSWFTRRRPEGARSSGIHGPLMPAMPAQSSSPVDSQSNGMHNVYDFYSPLNEGRRDNRRLSMISEMTRQSKVFFDDQDFDMADDESVIVSEEDEMEEETKWKGPAGGEWSRSVDETGFEASGGESGVENVTDDEVFEASGAEKTRS